MPEKKPRKIHVFQFRSGDADAVGRLNRQIASAEAESGCELYFLQAVARPGGERLYFREMEPKVGRS